MSKRPRTARLSVRWGKRGRDVLYDWEPMSQGKCDGGMLSWFFEGVKGTGGKTLREELERRGYDLTTIRFRIDLEVGSERDPATRPKKDPAHE